MELLAPAGSLEHFTAAVESGADSVYVGAPGFNARNPSREFRWDEIRAMASYCKDHGLSFYIALNSLVREDEIARLIKTLAELESIARPIVLLKRKANSPIAADVAPGAGQRRDLEVLAVARCGQPGHRRHQQARQGPAKPAHCVPWWHNA